MAVLEVAIGVIFFLVTLSLLTSTVAEWWSRKQDKRGALLEDGIRLLLGGRRQRTKEDGGLMPFEDNLLAELLGRFQQWFAKVSKPLLAKFSNRPPANAAAANDLGPATNGFLEGVLEHPLIRTRGTAEFPQAIAPKDFARAVLAVAGGDQALQGLTDLKAVVAKIEEPRIQQALTALLTGSQTTIEDFQARIATWFESAMDETTKLYRAAMNLVVRWFAVVIVLALNADALVLIEVLWKDPVLRATLVAAAENLEQEHRTASKDGEGEPTDAEVEPAASDDATDELGASSGKTLEQIIASARKDLAPFPIGWPSCSEWDTDPRGLPAKRGLIVGVLMKLAGWAVTILAVSLGAPFWFDLLRQLISLRRGGSEPAAPPHSAAAPGK